jgi:hypothetical protein
MEPRNRYHQPCSLATKRVVISDRPAGNRFLGSIKSLLVRAHLSTATKQAEPLLLILVALPALIYELSTFCTLINLYKRKFVFSRPCLGDFQELYSTLVRCTKSIRVVFLLRRSPPLTLLVLFSRVL